jgi:site-specific DNA-methyltransferase (adenine-specific)
MTQITINDATLYLGDCREILPTLPRVNAIVTDPPYGVDLKGKRTKRAASEQNHGYSSLTKDDESIFDRTIKPALFDLAKSDRVIVTPGIRLMFRYPEPADVGCAFFPAGAGLGRWGFVGFQPILYYGKCPYLASGKGHRPSSLEIAGIAEKASDDRHPVSKPIRWTEFLVVKASADMSDVILDPFMGSGTTGVACANLGRKFVGIEIEQKYFDVACERIERAYSQQRLFA